MLQFEHLYGYRISKKGKQGNDSPHTLPHITISHKHNKDLAYCYMPPNTPNIDKCSVHRRFKDKVENSPYSIVEYKEIKLLLCTGSDILIAFGGIYTAVLHLTH